jgi:hypothetical protein
VASELPLSGSENIHRAQGRQVGKGPSPDSLEQDAKAVRKKAMDGGTLRHKGKVLGTYSVSEDGKKLTIILHSK